MLSIQTCRFWIFMLVFFSSCRKDLPPPSADNFPQAVSNIFRGSCAVPGCHNPQSRDAAGGIDISSWDKLFEGGSGGSVVVPFRPDQSTLMFFINTYSDLGISLFPTMPLSNSASYRQPLSRSQVLLLRDWILSGAPSESGKVMFADNPGRKKFYVVNQGCDLVGVYDAATRLLMRYVDAGTNVSVIESPHMIRISPDGQYFYVVLYSGNVVQKFRTSDDHMVGEVSIGTGLWNTIAISPDSKQAFAVDWEPNGKIAQIDLDNMQLTATWQGSQLFEYPHGSAVNATGDTLYLTGQTGNFICKVPVADPGSATKVSLQLGIQPGTNPAVPLDCHDIVFSPDYKYYFVTCQFSNEVRMMETAGDSLLAVFPVGDFPQEMSISEKKPYLFVSSMEDSTMVKQGRGSVAVIDYQSRVVKFVYTGYQPHGIAVDDDKSLVYVANRNRIPAGPAPHHTSACGGRNGYITAIDMNTFELLDFKSETAADPYSVAVRN